MSTVIQHSQSDRSTLSRTVERLLKRGLIEKLSDPNDKRAFRVRRLKCAENIYRDAYELVAKHDSEMLKHFSPDERENLSMLLEQFNQES